jgi:hypothetical protein
MEEMEHRMLFNELQDRIYWVNSWFVNLRPRLFIDGNQWCALYGENLQDGVAGFGDSPADAARAFDAAMTQKLEDKA